MPIDVDSLYMEKLADEYFNRKMNKGEGFDLKHGWRKIFKETYAQAIQDNAEALRFLEYAKDSDLYYEFKIQENGN